MIPEVAASETGRAQTFTCKRQALRRGSWDPQAEAALQHRVTKLAFSGTVWKSRRNRVIAPYAKSGQSLSGDPKYAGTREILAELAATMR